MSVISLKYTPDHTKHTVCDLFDVCDNHTTFKTDWTRIKRKNVQFMLSYDCDLEIKHVIKTGMNWKILRQCCTFFEHLKGQSVLETKFY